MANVAVKGLKELNRELEQLPVKLKKTAVRRAVAAGAKVILQKAKATAPRRTGTVRRAIARRSRNNRSQPTLTRQSIYVRTGRNRTKGQIKKGDNAYYWIFQEFGYRAIGRKKKNYKGRKGREKYRSSGRKIQGRKFMQKSFDTSSGRALVMFRKTLNKELEVYRAG